MFTFMRSFKSNEAIAYIFLEKQWAFSSFKAKNKQCWNKETRTSHSFIEPIKVKGVDSWYKTDSVWI
jgi:hypothetical protein